MLGRLSVGPLGENVYVLPSRGPGGQEGRCVLVDPGDEAARILSFLDSRGLTPDLVVLSHGHLDHSAAIPELFAAYAARGGSPGLAIHALDASYLGEGGEATNRSTFAAIRALGFFKSYWRPLPAPTLLLEEGSLVPGTGFRVIHSPGHTAGSICLYDEAAGILVSGDTLFRDGIGRSDGPDSDGAALGRSIRRLMALPPSTEVLPGHGEPTTIGREAPSFSFGDD
ncbi:MAG TPA: MBL fold metallo-hydrolase [Spirochaetales bacterium]|nr:MBL fold metallo-hydrolase [Spirochaetales bacterium]HRY54150.1 MBL fold metallo-hydrolase [Spirochaetia bacterium]